MMCEGIEMAVIIWCWTSGYRWPLLSNTSVFIIHHIFTRIAAYACTFLLHSMLELSFLVSSIIKNFRRFLKCILVCLKQLIQEYNLCQQLYTTLCLAENRCQYHIIELTFSLSFHIPYNLSVTSFQNFYHQFLTLLHIQLLAGGMVS